MNPQAGRSTFERTKTISFGLLQVRITLSLTTDSGQNWEERAAFGMSDRELVQLNGRNTRLLESAIWEQRHQLLVSGPWP
jgi:hypothetical protein